MRRFFFLLWSLFHFPASAQDTASSLAKSDTISYKKVVWRFNGIQKRYFSDFRETKQNVDSFTLIEPFTHVHFLTEEKANSDTLTANSIQRYLKRRTYSILSQKYWLDTTFRISSFNPKDVRNFLVDLELIRKSVKRYPVPKFIGGALKGASTRYTVMVFLHAAYWRWNGESVTTLVIVDVEQNEIVYVDRNFQDFARKEIHLIDVSLLKLLRPFYYNRTKH